MGRSIAAPAVADRHLGDGGFRYAVGPRPNPTSADNASFAQALLDEAAKPSESLQRMLSLPVNPA